MTTPARRAWIEQHRWYIPMDILGQPSPQKIDLLLLLTDAMAFADANPIVGVEMFGDFKPDATRQEDGAKETP